MNPETLISAGAPASATAEAKTQRLAHFDWMRGLACVLMFQTHCYDSWLSPAARQTKFFSYSQILGALPAPLFLFLAGISAVLVIRKLSGDGGVSRAAAARLVRRGGFVWGLGMLFRLQEYLIAWHWAPWTDLLRVDILNCIGVSLMLIGLLAYISPSRSRMAANAAVVCAAISMLSPVVWTHRLTALPWFLESYIDGVHNLGKPLPWLFPIFPWAAFAFAGVVAGSLLLSETAKRHHRWLIPIVATAGLLISALGYMLDHLPIQLYSVYDFWHTSPTFFLIRLGVLLMIVALSDLRCRLIPMLGRARFLILMGRDSLLVYWVHIEFVYGRFSILPRHGLGIKAASAGLTVIALSMFLLCVIHQRWKRRRKTAAVRSHASRAAL